MQDSSQPRLTPEVSLSEAARILAVDRRTVKALIQQGVLRARIAGLPNSQKPRYRLPKSEVLDLRNSYYVFSDSKKNQPSRKNTVRKSSSDLGHIDMNS